MLNIDRRRLRRYIYEYVYIVIFYQLHAICNLRPKKKTYLTLHLTRRRCHVCVKVWVFTLFFALLFATAFFSWLISRSYVHSIRSQLLIIQCFFYSLFSIWKSSHSLYCLLIIAKHENYIQIHWKIVERKKTTAFTQTT